MIGTTLLLAPEFHYSTAGNAEVKNDWHYTCTPCIFFQGVNTKILPLLITFNPQGKRRRGRPKKSWKRTVEEEARDQGKRRQEVKAVAKNKVRWRSFVKALCCS